MDGIETFESPLLADVQINADGTLKQSGKQNVKFYRAKRQVAKARPLWVKQDDGTIALDSRGNKIQAKDEKGKLLFDIDPKTGIPFKDYSEDVVEMIRVETKGDTNIKEDIADPIAKRQFSHHYKHFRSGKIPDGHPIEDFQFIQPQTMTELHMYGIHTIEQVGEMDEVSCEQITGQSGFEIRDIAQQWIRINSTDGQAGKATRLEIENARLKAEVETLKNNGRKTRSIDAQAQALREQDEAPAEPETRTMELSPEDLKTRRARKV